MFQVKRQYDKTTSEITISLDKNIDKQVYLYYGLSHFLTNHRRFLNSRDESQLAGESISVSALKDCDPRISDGLVKPEQAEYPCGLVSWAEFNDTFTLYKDGVKLDSSTVDLVKSYQKKLYKCPDDNCPGKDVTDEQFISWMQPVPYSYFSKKLQIYKNGLEKGDYILKINEDNTQRLNLRSSADLFRFTLKLSLLAPAGPNMSYLQQKLGWKRKHYFLVCLHFSFLTNSASA